MVISLRKKPINKTFKNMILNFIIIISIVIISLFGYRYYINKTNTNNNYPDEITKVMKRKFTIRTILGLTICIIGIILTSIAKGNTFFYGAIIGGLFMLLSGVFNLIKIK